MQLKTLKQIIDETIIEYFHKFDGSRLKTAAALGIGLKTLYRHLKRLGIK